MMPDTYKNNFQDTKGKIRNCKQKKDRQYNGKRKKENNDPQNITLKLRIDQHETYKNTEAKSGASEGHVVPAPSN